MQSAYVGIYKWLYHSGCWSKPLAYPFVCYVVYTTDRFSHASASWKKSGASKSLSTEWFIVCLLYCAQSRYTGHQRQSAYVGLFLMPSPFAFWSSLATGRHNDGSFSVSGLTRDAQPNVWNTRRSVDCTQSVGECVAHVTKRLNSGKLNGGSRIAHLGG
jgi:hypothetical protein